MVTSIFGIGSLVNLRTHETPALSKKKAYVIGYRRDWTVTYPAHGKTFLGLGLVPDRTANHEIPGLELRFTSCGFEEIFSREKDYNFLNVETVDEYGNKGVAMSFSKAPIQEGLIALSYLATVADGFAETHGQDGIAKFISSTVFQGKTLYDDRNRPTYLRTQVRDASTYDYLVRRMRDELQITVAA